MQPEELDRLARNLSEKIVDVYNQGGGFSGLQKFSSEYRSYGEKVLRKYVSFLGNEFMNPAKREIQLFSKDVLPIVRAFLLEDVLSSHR